PGPHRNHAADGAGTPRSVARPLLDRDTTDEVGIDKGRIGDALIAAIHGGRVLGAIDRDRNAPLPLQAAYVGIDAAAGATLAGIDAGHAPENVRRARSAIALDLLRGNIGA